MPQRPIVASVHDTSHTASDPRPEDLAQQIEDRLRALGRPERAAREKAYLKSDLEFAGATVPETHKAVKELLGRSGTLDRDALVALVTDLWQRELFECRMAAVDLLESSVVQLTPDDMALLESLIRRSMTWALVDGLAASVVGVMLGRYAEIGADLDRWVGDSNFWVRRSALLALLHGIRRGEPDLARLARYSDELLDESEFFIRKAIGWVLREVGKRDPDFVGDWLSSRTDRASGVTMREAVKYLPEHDGARLMSAYRQAHGR